MERLTYSSRICTIALGALLTASILLSSTVHFSIMRCARPATSLRASSRLRTCAETGTVYSLRLWGPSQDLIQHYLSPGPGQIQHYPRSKTDSLWCILCLATSFFNSLTGSLSRQPTLIHCHVSTLVLHFHPNIDETAARMGKDQ